MAVEASDCDLSVSPTEGPPGTEFVFSGSGYSPTQFTLRQAGTEPVVFDPELGGVDPWEFPFVATEAEAGRWAVIASIPETECAGKVVIRVNLPDTSIVAKPTEPPIPQGQGLILAAGGLVALFILATGLFVRRVSLRA